MRKFLTLICVLAASITCKAQVNPNPNFNNVMLKGEVALITDMSQAMEYVWTPGDIDAETLKKGCFIQTLGDWYITDGNNGYFETTNYNGQYGYSYDWKDFQDESNPLGSLAKYGPTYMYTYGLEAANSQAKQYWKGYVMYVKYDPTIRVFYQCVLRGYIGHYDWHDFYLQGYARTFEGTDPFTGDYDYDAVKNDPLASYVYNINNTSEYHDSIPLFFNENPYQVDGPCVLMYKGKPWPLKLVSVESMDDSRAEQCQVDPGTPWLWDYNTDPQGDTINLQSGVYIFFLSYYNQKDNAPLTFTVQRCDYGRSLTIGTDTLKQAGDYEVDNVTDDESGTSTDPTDPTYNPGTTPSTGDLVLKSYRTWQEKKRTYRYKTYVLGGSLGVQRKMEWYYKYINHTSSTYYDYPVDGLAEQLGYTGYIAIPYAQFSNYEPHTNHASIIDNGYEVKVEAEKDKGIPVVIYNRTIKSVKAVIYITDAQYEQIKAYVAPIQGASGQDIIYDLNGRQINEADMHSGRIYIRNRKPMIFR